MTGFSARTATAGDHAGSGRDGDVEIGSGNLLLSDSDEVLGTHTPTSMA